MRSREQFVWWQAVLVLMTVFALWAPWPARAQTIQNDPQPPRLVADSPAAGAWQNTLTSSLRLLAIEHFVRVTFHEKTQRDLGGPFLADYMRSLRRPDGWGDGDGWGMNYVGHPLHGAAAGYVWLGSRREDEVDELFSKAYLASRGRAAAFAAAYSLQFELGPLSEASIGNVGMHPNTTGWVDHVMTPAGAFGLMIAEDWLDRALVTRFESRVRNPFFRLLTRMALNPSRSFALVAQGEMPWERRRRPLR
jgi:hypothetical protein